MTLLGSGLVSVAQSVPSAPQCGAPPKIKIPNSNTAGNSNPASNSIASAPCPQPAPQTTPQVESSQHPVKRVFLRNDRIEVIPPHKLILAQEAEIPLVLHSQGLASVNVSQVQYRYPNRQGPDPAHGSEMKVPILNHADGSPYIKIIPMRLGQVELDLSGIFPDGGLFHKEVKFDVEPPERKPVKLVVGQGGSPQSTTPVILMHLSGENRNSLNVNAQYDNVAELLEIDPSFPRFVVRTRDNKPIIHLDESTGIITPLNVGQALIETWFGGKKNLTCVEVTQNIGDWYDHSLCKGLLASGEELPRKE